VGFAAWARRPLERRRAEWLARLEAQIKELETSFKGLNPPALADNEEFISALVLGLRAAEAAHEESIRSALANAVISSAMPGAPDADQQKIYLRFIGEFTPSHLRVLAFMDDPRAVLDAQGVPQPDWDETSSRKKLLEWAIPDFEGRPSFVDQINRDLIAAGLTEGSFDWANWGPGSIRVLAYRLGQGFPRIYRQSLHRALAGHGPTLFAGLSKHVDLKLVSRLEFGSGAVAMRYEPRR